ncbi:NAD-dependent epimerase/dehydratase family protein (plasmid) [Rhizobium sp. C104]|uniref:NAD-dependent epimerase/dehydratase family protein n=1 Tax=Rhizobium sp. C104 TaxID=2917727 RepID=UPI001EF903F9|nr:NAD-dependent epimerase/dehydratase family protein [Rhizobium sp. C104]ULJ81673.1 NAD-dependent epimerase/dehydratase family protein [Rhizobium sp. C104]
MNAARKSSQKRQDCSGAGGAGFVRSHLCDALLARGDWIICVDSYITGCRDDVWPLTNHPRFRLVEKDVCEFVEIDEPVDQIYNLACAASPPQYQADPIHTMMTCVAGTGNLLALAERHGASFLWRSAEHPQREDYRGNVSCIGPRACYDEGKRAAEALCFEMLRAGRVDARVARIFNTCGPRMQADDGRIVSNLVVQALSGKSLTIYGSGTQTRSFCYVSDLVRGLMALMDVRPNPAMPVNLGNPGEFSINALAEMIRTMVPAPAALVYKPLPKDDPQRRRPDISRAIGLLNWQPAVPLAEGLGYTIEWFANSLGELPRPRTVAPNRLHSTAASQPAPAGS